MAVRSCLFAVGLGAYQLGGVIVFLSWKQQAQSCVHQHQLSYEAQL